MALSCHLRRSTTISSKAGKCSPWCSRHAVLGASCCEAPLAPGHVNVVSWSWCAKSLLSWALARLAPSCARNAVFVLLPGEVGALQVQGWMLSVLAAAGVPVLHCAERSPVAASKPAVYWPSERGSTSKINGTTLSKLIFHCSPVGCDYLVCVQSHCLKAEIADDEARKGQD